eukprot:8458892-Heterocapsa_arctica.AAC.1
MAACQSKTEGALWACSTGHDKSMSGTHTVEFSGLYTFGYMFAPAWPGRTGGRRAAELQAT